MKKTLQLLLTLALFVCNMAVYADGDENSAKVRFILRDKI